MDDSDHHVDGEGAVAAAAAFVMNAVVDMTPLHLETQQDKRERTLWQAILCKTVTRFVATSYAHSILMLVLTIQVNLLRADDSARRRRKHHLRKKKRNNNNNNNNNNSSKKQQQQHSSSSNNSKGTSTTVPATAPAKKQVSSSADSGDEKQQEQQQHNNHLLAPPLPQPRLSVVAAMLNPLRHFAWTLR
jgi:cobalamin biosynthesis Mg chelatase CobN